jgi:hypothetical protein
MLKLMKKIRKALQPFLNLSLNLNLAILKMRIGNFMMPGKGRY